MAKYHADALIRRANVITINPALPRASAVAMCDGRFIGVGSNAKGGIQVGKLADLVVLDADPTAVDPYAIKDIPVERTIVGGRTVYEG